MNKNKDKKFWNFTSQQNNTPAELILYGEIASTSWWGDEVTLQAFNDDLKALGDISEIIVRINSGGGDVFAANAIYTRLKDHKAHITVKIDGWAASAATIIAMAGDVIEIPIGGTFMIHDPKMGVYAYCSSDDLIKCAEELDVIKNSIINTYVAKTGKSAEEIAQMMTAETWLTGNEAVDAGFCDKLMFEEVETQVQNASKVIVNSVNFDISNYNNIPQSLLNSQPQQANDGVNNINNKVNNKEENKMPEIKNAEDLKNQYPELVKDIENNAVNKERDRIKNIEDLQLSGFEDIVQNAKFENPLNAADVAMKIVAQQKKLGKDFLNNRETDIKNSNIGEVENTTQEIGKTDNFDSIIDKVAESKRR